MDLLNSVPPCQGLAPERELFGDKPGLTCTVSVNNQYLLSVVSYSVVRYEGTK